jgi:hypothetical protein
LFEAPPADDAEPRRQIALAGRLVEFRFRRRRRRTMGLSINEHGLAVAAPLRAPWHEIEGFVRSHARWIIAKLEQWAAAERRPPFHGHSGESLPLHGANVMLEVRAGRRGVALQGERLVVTLRDPARTVAVRSLLVHWLKAHALQALAPRAAHHAARIGLGAPALAISNARAQWGVCTAGGLIRLSFRLAHLEPELADYVVAHEVAHLVELNHSKRFWRLIETLYPDWRAARHRIRLAAATLPIL